MRGSSIVILECVLKKEFSYKLGVESSSELELMTVGN
jgi:hypothetical protein